MAIKNRRKVFPTEESLQMATEAAEIGVWDLALPSNDLQWSNRCNEIFGLPLDAELKYDDFLERVHREDRLRVDAVVQDVLNPNGTGNYYLEYRIVRPNGEVRWVAAKGKAFFLEDGGHLKAYRFLGTLLDRTDYRRTQQALIESEKLAVTGRLAASIAHEIKNPSDAVCNLLYLLRTEGSERLRAEYVALAEQELSRASDIASHTLRFYRDPGSSHQSCDIDAMLDTVLGIFHARVAQQKVAIRKRLKPGLLVFATHGELRQVLVNLVGNALDAVPVGGNVLIRARRSAIRNGNNVILTIADDGSGMTPEVKSRIFEPFYTTKSDRGNGIGLWLSLEILKKHGSKIRVKSQLGRGSVFSLFLDA